MAEELGMAHDLVASQLEHRPDSSGRHGSSLKEDRTKVGERVRLPLIPKYVNPAFSIFCDPRLLLDTLPVDYALSPPDFAHYPTPNLDRCRCTFSLIAVPRSPFAESILGRLKPSRMFADSCSVHT